MANRLTKLTPAMAWAVAGAVAVRRSQRGWAEVVPATSAPIDHVTGGVGRL